MIPDELQPFRAQGRPSAGGLRACSRTGARRSGCAATVRLVQLPHLPKGETYDADLRRIALECQVAGGDDYELCFTAPGSQSQAIAQIAARLELPLWCIGEMTAGPAGEVAVLDPDGQPVEFERRGYEHFA